MCSLDPETEKRQNCLVFIYLSRFPFVATCLLVALKSPFEIVAREIIRDFVSSTRIASGQMERAYRKSFCAFFPQLKGKGCTFVCNDNGGIRGRLAFFSDCRY